MKSWEVPAVKTAVQIGAIVSHVNNRVYAKTNRVGEAVSLIASVTLRDQVESFEEAFDTEFEKCVNEFGWLTLEPTQENAVRAVKLSKRGGLSHVRGAIADFIMFLPIPGQREAIDEFFKNLTALLNNAALQLGVVTDEPETVVCDDDSDNTQRDILEFNC